MALIKTLNGKTPQIGEGGFVAENATVIGDVVVGKECTIWYNTVIRGDVNRIQIGDRVNIQDLTMVHCTYKTAPTCIGNDVSIGHSAIIHGCELQDYTLIGMGSIVMDGVVVETGAIVAAGAVVTQNTQVKSRKIYAGTPAKEIGEVSDEMFEKIIKRTADGYVKYAGWYQD